MSLAETNLQVDFPCRRTDVFNGILAALRGLGPSFWQSRSGMELESADEFIGHIAINAGRSGLSWGETILVTLTEPTTGYTRVTVVSTPKVGLAGAVFDFGKNRRNVEELLRETSRILKSWQSRPEPPPLPPVQDNLIKCACNHCEVNIEFPAHGVGQTITCPNCGMDTVLYKPEC